MDAYSLIINLSLDTPNGAMVTECFKSQGAHEIHNRTPHMNLFREEMSKVLVEGRFQNIFSDTFTVDEVKFA